jgi:hypothetical protein
VGIFLFRDRDLSRGGGQLRVALLAKEEWPACIVSTLTHSDDVVRTVRQHKSLIGGYLGHFVWTSYSGKASTQIQPLDVGISLALIWVSRISTPYFKAYKASPYRLRKRTRHTAGQLHWHQTGVRLPRPSRFLPSHMASEPDGSHVPESSSFRSETARGPW